MSSVLSIAALEEIRALRDLSRALTTATEVRSVANAAAQCLAGVLGEDRVTVWLAEDLDPGRDGGPDPARRGLASEADVWAVLDSSRPARVRRDDGVLAIWPLSCGGDAVGVLEALVDEHRVDDVWDLLETTAAQVALALHGLHPGAAGRPVRSTVDGRADGVADLDLAVAWTAHELRGPLSALRASLEFLRVHGASPEHAVLLDRCVVEIDHMSSVVRDVLEWRPETEPVASEDVDVVDVVRQSIDQARLEFGVDRVRLEAPDRVVAPIEPVQIRSAVGNLIRNAVAYSPARTPVDVTVADDGQALSIGVRNAGRAEPVDGQDAGTIFRPYVRGANGNGRAGTGLGLFIARRIAEANGGDLTLRLADDATEFLLRFPRSA